MIEEYHLACVLKGPNYASPILPEALENYLPPRDDYTRPDHPDYTTDVRVWDNKARTFACRSVAPSFGHDTQMQQGGC